MYPCVDSEDGLNDPCGISCYSINPWENGVIIFGPEAFHVGNYGLVEQQKASLAVSSLPET